MKTVIAIRGIPGSGKSTLAREIIAADEECRTVRINNDDILAMLYGVSWRRQPGIADMLKLTRESLLKAYLKDDYVDTVIIDNTNLATRTVSDLQRITTRMGAKFVVNDSLLNVSVDVCIERDALREVPVGAEVIRTMAKDASKLKPWKYPEYEIPEITRYKNFTVALPHVYIFDIDGTIALNTSHRDIYDETRVLQDTSNIAVVEIYLALSRIQNRKIIFMTGRHETCRNDTMRWLKLNVDKDITHEQLFMRPSGDSRPDYIVKHELFQQHIAGVYNVVCCFDDRDQVVDLWRNKLGLPTLQVADGDF
jgi:predicted kinase